MWKIGAEPLHEENAEDEGMPEFSSRAADEAMERLKPMFGDTTITPRDRSLFAAGFLAGRIWRRDAGEKDSG